MKYPPEGKPYYVLPVWQGQIAAILASGPSVEELDLGPLRSCRVVAINTSYHFYPRADFVFTGGWQFFSRHQYTWPGDLFCVDFRAWRLSLAPARATYIGHGKDTGLEDRRTHVSGRYSSVNQATSMLAHLGVDKIIYVGLDLAPRSDGLRRAGDTELDTPDAGARYQRMADNLHTMAKPLRARGIEVVNASPTDRLPWWPKMTLREATSI